MSTHENMILDGWRREWEFRRLAATLETEEQWIEAEYCYQEGMLMCGIREVLGLPPVSGPARTEAAASRKWHTRCVDPLECLADFEEAAEVYGFYDFPGFPAPGREELPSYPWRRYFLANARITDEHREKNGELWIDATCSSTAAALVRRIYPRALPQSEMGKIRFSRVEWLDREGAKHVLHTPPKGRWQGLRKYCWDDLPGMRQMPLGKQSIPEWRIRQTP